MRFIKENIDEEENPGLLQETLWKLQLLRDGNSIKVKFDHTLPNPFKIKL